MFFVLVWLLVEANPSKLDSVFLSIDNLHSGASTWNASRWDVAFADLSAIDIHNVILANAVTETSAHYPTKIPGLKTVSSSTVRDVLEAAHRHGATVHLGVILRNEWFKHGAMNVTYMKELLQISVAVSGELVELYGLYPAFAGLYNTAEVWSQCCYGKCSDALAARLAVNFLEPFGRAVHDLKVNGKPAKYIMAPFFVNSSTPAEEVEFWKTILDNTPSLDIIAFQDGVGVGHVTGPGQAMDYLAPLSSLAATYTSLQFWTDVEIFIKHPAYKVAPSARVFEQLTKEATVTSGRTCWEYSNYMDPHEDIFPGSKRLYEDYKKWLG